MVPYSAPRGVLRALPATIRRRPRIRVHFGAPVDLRDLRHGVAGHAQQATDRILDAITRELAALRADEPGIPRHVDPTRPRDPSRSRADRPGTTTGTTTTGTTTAGPAGHGAGDDQLDPRHRR